MPSVAAPEDRLLYFPPEKTIISCLQRDQLTQNLSGVQKKIVASLAKILSEKPVVAHKVQGKVTDVMNEANFVASPTAEYTTCLRLTLALLHCATEEPPIQETLQATLEGKHCTIL